MSYVYSKWQGNVSNFFSNLLDIPFEKESKMSYANSEYYLCNVESGCRILERSFFCTVVTCF